MRIPTRVLTISGLLIALSIVFTRFMTVQIPIAGMPSVRLGLGALPIIIAGFIGGPVAGALVGGGSDFLGFLVNPMAPGAYLPQITAVYALTGALPALICSQLSRSRRMKSLLRYFVSIGIAQIVLQVGLMSLILWQLYYAGTAGSATFGLLVTSRFIAQIILIPLFSLASLAIIEGVYGRTDGRAGIRQKA